MNEFYVFSLRDICEQNGQPVKIRTEIAQYMLYISINIIEIVCSRRNELARVFPLKIKKKNDIKLTRHIRVHTKINFAKNTEILY